MFEIMERCIVRFIIYYIRYVNMLEHIRGSILDDQYQ